MVSDFKELKVWQKAIEFVVLVYKLSAGFPKCEIYGLTSQIRRAAVSVTGNIAEGSGKFSSADFKRFLCISFGSLKEVENYLIIANRLEYLNDEGLKCAKRDCDEVGKMLNGLIKYLKEKVSK